MPITPEEIINSAYNKVEKQRDDANKGGTLLIAWICILLEKGFNGIIVLKESEVSEMIGDLHSGKKQRSIKVSEQEKTITLEIKLNDESPRVQSRPDGQGEQGTE